MELFNRAARYFRDQATAQKREHAQTVRRTGNEGKAKALEYEADTQERRQRAAEGRYQGLD